MNAKNEPIFNRDDSEAIRQWLKGKSEQTLTPEQTQAAIIAHERFHASLLALRKQKSVTEQANHKPDWFF